MTGAGLFALVIGLAIGISLIGLYIYGVVLAIKLMCKGEWQWFCLPFIAIPISLAGKAVENMPFAFMAPDEVLSNVIWALFSLILVAFLSGFAVYWLMWRYRKETAFVHFYAVNYLLAGIGLLIGAGLIFTGDYAGIEAFFSGVAAILALYGFITGLAGIAAMRKRVRRYKKNHLNMPHNSTAADTVDAMAE
ncbi:MAG: hypothetical protein DU430_01630 [Candidatus Tokpelaia sp.]|nr:MAG: hypothetical protein DU430_01630 [Candidatus Tokpelaia sp.]